MRSLSRAAASTVANMRLGSTPYFFFSMFGMSTAGLGSVRLQEERSVAELGLLAERRSDSGEALMTDETPGANDVGEDLDAERRGGLACTSPAPKLAARLLGELFGLRVLGLELVILELLEVQQSLVGALGHTDELVELDLHGLGVPVLCVWIKNTIKKVTMGVPVLMTSCQVSLK